MQLEAMRLKLKKEREELLREVADDVDKVRAREFELRAKER